MLQCSQFFDDVNSAGMFYFKRVYTSFNDDTSEVTKTLDLIKEEINQDEGPSTVFCFYSGYGLIINNQLHAVLKDGSKINLERFAV